MRLAKVGFTVCALIAVTAHALAQQAPAKKSDKATAAPIHAKPFAAPHEEEGQRIFQANCARCHATPEGFSPRISGTIVRHMRVRASLSAHDEEELRRFFNP